MIEDILGMDGIALTILIVSSIILIAVFTAKYIDEYALPVFQSFLNTLKAKLEERQMALKNSAAADSDYEAGVAINSNRHAASTQTMTSEDMLPRTYAEKSHDYETTEKVVFLDPESSIRVRIGFMSGIKFGFGFAVGVSIFSLLVMVTFSIITFFAVRELVDFVNTMQPPSHQQMWR